MNIGNLFTVEIEELKELLINDSSKCFYIPAYQRPYSWDVDQVNRVWEDLRYGIEELSRTNDYVTFLGSIITIHDTNYQSISPMVIKEVPTKVLLIIDGQQRLTTLLLLIITIEDMIYANLTKESKGDLAEVFSEILHFSGHAYKSEKSHGLNDNIMYPKVIRAYADQWSYSNQENYESPIAQFLNEYIMHREKSKEKEIYKSFNLNLISSSDDLGVNKIIKNIKQFRKLIGDYITDNNNHSLHEKFINNAEKLSVSSELLESFKERHITNKKYREIFLLSLIMRYLFQRVFISHIKAKKEEYAFEMFDSLNTTGDRSNRLNN